MVRIASAPIHSAADERRGEHVGWDAGGHGNPERGKIPDAPFAAVLGHWGEVVVVEAALLQSSDLLSV